MTDETMNRPQAVTGAASSSRDGTTPSPRRIAWITAIAAATLIPIVMISGLVGDREARETDVQQTIARSWGPAQTVGSPTFVVPVTDRSGVKSYLRVPPKTLAIKAALALERRKRGIYAATVYTATIEMAGTFALSDALAQAAGDGAKPSPDASLIALFVPSLAGVEAADAATIDGAKAAWQACADLLAAEACHDATDLVASAGTAGTKATDVAFTAILHLRGTQAFALELAGKEVSATIAGAWPSPSFTGDVLPAQTTSNAGVFEARWRHDEIGRPRPTSGIDVLGPRGTTIGVDLIEATPVYRMIERASKYAPMIVALAFTTYFLLELLAHIRVTLLQYALLGASLSLFTLLLLSVSEILGYPAGYALSALLVMTQASLYTASVARRRRPAIVFATALAALFGFLYVLLGLESYALVVGAVALFLVLSIVMAATQSLTPVATP